MNVEDCQGQINERFGTEFNIPVDDDSQMLAIVFGKEFKAAGPDSQAIKPLQLEKIAGK